MSEISIGGFVFEYEIFKERRKTIALSINEDRKLIIKAPNRCGKDIIEEFIIDKQQWIINNLKRLEELNSSRIIRQFTSEESMPLLGNNYPLIIKKGKGDTVTVGFDGKVFYGNIPELLPQETRQEHLKLAFIKLYKKLAKGILKERTDFYCKVINVNFNRITVKEQKTLWGSCSSRNNINYNYKIVMAPLQVLDYVVIHELCHIRHRNHSKQYWNEVAKYMKDYEEKRKWLKNEGMKLQLEHIYKE